MPLGDEIFPRQIKTPIKFFPDEIPDQSLTFDEASWSKYQNLTCRLPTVTKQFPDSENDTDRTLNDRKRKYLWIYIINTFFYCSSKSFHFPTWVSKVMSHKKNQNFTMNSFSPKAAESSRKLSKFSKINPLSTETIRPALHNTFPKSSPKLKGPYK